MTYSFEKDAGSELIMVTVKLDEKDEFKMVLDTAASLTTFDSNALYMANYPIGNVIEKGIVETANGIVAVDVIEIDEISAFGYSVRGMKVQIYDFLEHGILSDYEGLLGLDFFKNTKFCIDMNNQTIEVFGRKSNPIRRKNNPSGQRNRNDKT